LPSDGTDYQSLPNVVVALLPTPQARDEKGYGPADLDRNDPNLSALPALLPTPMVGSSSPASHGQVSGQWREQMQRALANWGEYGPAIRRHEQMLDRPVPAPTKPNSKGKPKLSDEFDEWLMGLPAGWITDVPGITWNEVLKACGNGVLPQQAAAAIRWLLSQLLTDQTNHQDQPDAAGLSLSRKETP